MFKGGAKSRAFAAACLLILGTSAGTAQVLAPKPLIVGGIEVGCGSVPIYLNSGLNDFGYASITPYGSFITLNPDRLASVAPVVQVFIFAHECGHLVTAGSETAADCWAIQNGKLNGWFGPINYPFLVQTMRDSPGDFTHPPGPARLQNIVNCYNAI